MPQHRLAEAQNRAQRYPRRAHVATQNRTSLRVRRRNIPKDLRFSIGPDIKDALPGFSWSIWCLIAGWVCPLVSVSRIGYGVWSGECVLLVVLMWWERWWCSHSVRLRRWGAPSAGSWQERARCDLIGPTVILLLHIIQLLTFREWSSCSVDCSCKASSEVFLNPLHFRCLSQSRSTLRDARMPTSDSKRF
jgi:hypothetical protein